MLKPLRNYVLVKKLDDEEKKVGSIILTTNSPQYVKGTVLEVGPGVNNFNGELIPVAVSKGDVVLFSPHPHGSVELNEGGERLMLLREDDLLCIKLK